MVLANRGHMLILAFLTPQEGYKRAQIPVYRPVQKKVFSRAKPRFFKLRGNKLRYYTNDTVAQVIREQRQ